MLVPIVFFVLFLGLQCLKFINCAWSGVEFCVADKPAG